jgi:hypothetical protein
MEEKGNRSTSFRSDCVKTGGQKKAPTGKDFKEVKEQVLQILKGTLCRQ